MIKKILFIIVIFLLIKINVYAQETGAITIDAVQDSISVYLDEELYGIASGPSSISNLKQGVHTIKIEKEGYRTWKNQINIIPNKDFRLLVNLKEDVTYKKEYISKNKKIRFNKDEFLTINKNSASRISLHAQDTQSITINAAQDMVTIYINNELYGVVSGKCTIKNLKSGIYKLKFIKNGFLNEERTIELKQNEIVNIDLKIQKQKAYKKKNLDMPKSNNGWIYSFFLPGLGQLKQGYGLKGFLFLVPSAIITASIVLTYLEAEENYSLYKKAETRQEANHQHSIVEKNDKVFMYWQVAYVCVWGLNMIDILLWSKKSVNRNKVSIKFNNPSNIAFYYSIINYKY